MKRWIIKYIQKFRNLFKEPEITKPLIKVSDLKQFDDVFIVINHKVFKAWIMKKTSRLLQVFVWDTKREIIINITGQSQSTVIVFDRNNYLVLNEKDLCDYL